MAIVGGFDLHRRQITFEYVDTASGEVSRGRVAPADREHLRAWLRRVEGQEAAFAVEACTGWRFVVEAWGAQTRSPRKSARSRPASQSLRSPAGAAPTDGQPLSFSASSVRWQSRSRLASVPGAKLGSACKSA
jgi:transposase